MGNFRKKPVVIEAIQWKGNNLTEICDFVHEELEFTQDMKRLLIPTLESPHEASKGDWIIKGVKGEFYPCKPDIFKMTYEEA